MSKRADPARVRRALAERLHAVAEVLLDDVAPLGRDATADALHLLSRLVDEIRRTTADDAVWLLLVGITGVLPTSDEVHASRRRLELSTTGEATVWLLDRSIAELDRGATSLSVLDVVVGGVVVDVDFSARHNLNTGIQRVVRSTVPVWARTHELTLVAWSRSATLRRLTATERGRVLDWSGPVTPPRNEAPPADRVVVPWRSVVVLPEVPSPHQCGPLSALAEHSGNAVTAIGYDTIPIGSADLMPDVEPNRFVKYLTVIKHSRRVSGISASAAAEFRGFSHMLPAQGLHGPDVAECLLPLEVPASAARAVSTQAASSPLVVVVGSHEPRKNHLAVLYAAEVLWREGLAFRLRFIGGSSWASGSFDASVRRLRKRGRQVEVGRAIGDDDLWAAYREARFTVFPSTHEGYGLPVAESLAVGTPAITTDYGSTEEIGRDGGVVLVDPRDDEAITTAMRTLLTDDAALDVLRAQARDRPPRTWHDYATELWDQLVTAAAVDA